MCPSRSYGCSSEVLHQVFDFVLLSDPDVVHAFDLVCVPSSSLCIQDSLAGTSAPPVIVRTEAPECDGQVHIAERSDAKSLSSVGSDHDVHKNAEGTPVKEATWIMILGLCFFPI